MGSAAEAAKQFCKKYGDGAAGVGVDSAVSPRVRSGILEFDVNSGGGWPAYAMSVVAGPESVGKSILLYKTAATYHEDHPDEVVALLDLEGNYSSPWGKAFGVDESRLLKLAPDYGEQAADMICDVIEAADDVGLLLCDSLAQLVPAIECEKSAEDAVVGRNGLLISRLLRKTCVLLNAAKRRGRPKTVVYTNQFRSKIGVTMGDPRGMPGGNAPKYYANMIVYLHGGKETILPDVHPTRPALKHLAGSLKKPPKGPFLSIGFDADVALIPHGGARTGDSVNDWKFVSGYFAEMGLFGKQGKGWQVMGHEFPRQKDCRDWYESHRREAQAELTARLLADSSLVGEVEAGDDGDRDA